MEPYKFRIRHDGKQYRVESWLLNNIGYLGWQIEYPYYDTLASAEKRLQKELEIWQKYHDAGKATWNTVSEASVD